MAGWAYLLVSLLGAALVYNAARPSRHPWRLLPSWLLAFLTTDLAFVHILLAALVTAAFAWGGALETTVGALGLLVTALSCLALIVLWLPNLRAQRALKPVAWENRLDPVEPVPRALVLTPFKRALPGVEVSRDIEFRRAGGKSLKLDVYRSRAAGDPVSARRPGLVYLHGGGWIMGDKRDQGLPLCNHLARLGWVCVNANYRLSPGATWPQQVIDAKAAIAWLRDHAEEFGVDPDFIAIAGGSAGAHIAAMTALTPGDDGLQPGFETKDTSLQAVVTCYGAYDMTDKRGSNNKEFLTRYIGPLVIKAFVEEEPEKFEAASPLDNVAKVTMPWLVLQGDGDSLTPADGARSFVRALERASAHAVVYGELPGAQHAFDVFYSPRAIAAVELAARFLVTRYRIARDATQQEP